MRALLAVLAFPLAVWSITATSLSDFQLPSKAIFTPAQPRYPNLWIYVDPDLASNNYNTAVKLVTESLRTSLNLRETYNPALENGEGCDFEGRVDYLQPWDDRKYRSMRHAHVLRVRYYYTDLVRAKLEQVTLRYKGREKTFFRVAASVRYEVEPANPNAPDLAEQCPLCGRTRAYRDMKGPLPGLVHDPVGLELLFTGKARGEDVRLEAPNQPPIGSIELLWNRFGIYKEIFPALVGDKNTLRIGVVVLTPK